MAQNPEHKLITIIVPVFNEQENVHLAHAAITAVAGRLPFQFELLFVDDGSTDQSLAQIQSLVLSDPNVKYISFSRNFGKEQAISAGLNYASGDAAIIIDADLQHPPELIPEFIVRWQNGAEMVIGVRKHSQSAGVVKRVGSALFYKIINAISDAKIVPQSTDFRLIDRRIINEFNRLREHNRITRGLIDWLGFKKDYIYFEARPRKNGEAKYNFLKLVRLFINGIISMSLLPLRLAAWLGAFIIVASGALGVVMFLDRYIVRTWSFHFSGPAMLADIVLFLVGIILVCLGILAFYIGNIHEEVQDRPMYIIREKNENRTYLHLSTRRPKTCPNRWCCEL